MNNEQRKQAIENTVNTARTAISELRKLKDECPHNAIKTPTGSVKCDICKKYFGWDCSQSPDSVCHYGWEVEDKKIEMFDGSFVDIPNNCKIEINDGGHMYYCLFCGEPEERK